MRTPRLVSILPLMLLGSACSVDSTEADTQATPATQDSNLSAKAEGRGLEQLKAQRPEFFRGAGDVSLKRSLRDERGMTHERVTQSIRGVPVFGAQAILHLDANGAVVSVTDRLARDLKVDTTPGLRAEEAMQIAVAQVGGSRALRASPKADLQILTDDIGNGARLTYRVQLEALTDKGEPSMPNLFIDAHSGEVVKQFDNMKTTKNRKTYNAGNRTTLPGTLVRSEGQAPSGDAVLDQAHDNAGLTYDFYFNNYGRDSYNAAGGVLTSTVHYDRSYVNAYWNGTQMVYGDGNGVDSGPLTVLDVVAHELTHAVTDTESDLIYSNESGALNEAMSDVFGASVEAARDGAVSGNTWKIGEECWTPATAGDALRYMNDPALAGDYDYYPTRYTGTSDNGGVHWNSGIANLAFKLMVTGGTHPRGKTSNVVPALDANAYTSIQKGAAIFYRANTVYLTPGSTFSEARGATAQAATDLYGATAAAAVNEAWAAVGVAAPPSWTVIQTVSNLSGARSSNTNYTYATPAGATAMKFETIGGTGDADLYVKFGSAPTTTSYDCRSAGATSTETCTINGAKQGTYYVLIKGYTAYSGVTYKASSGQ
ncbi:Zn-dependent metalloprotease [Archangium gephyra]|uniref:Neutral metalloproteinase n=1 Tax=Archangium gephyra TaxID=48 RepID=A0AAC8THU7_9BACT|nr:M4 family metallopeptidase [Archangium gephyra]AKJ06602.1 Zinc metalloproteinase precursor/aureolysin [Archangium gephyra]REG32089.1 Zn-dependent metalloprotease [Archangium gephyra]